MTEQQKLESNIKKVYWLNGSFVFMVLMPIIVPFFQSRGLNMEKIYQLQSIFALFVLILEVPSGYISDLLGRKKTLILACIFESIGFGIFTISSDFMGLVIAEIVLAFAISLFSGTDLSVLYDSLNAMEKKKAPIKIVGKKVFFQQTGEALAGLVGGWLLLIHFEAPAILQAFVPLVPLGVAMTLYEPPRQKMSSTAHGENWRHIYRSLFKNSRLLNMILLNGMFFSFASLLAVWAFQDYWRELGIPLLYFGYLWFGINIVVGFFGRYAHKIEKRLGTEFLLILIGLLPIIGFLGMGWVHAFWGVIFCLAFQICRGLQSVIFQDALNKRVSGDMRATANSIMSLGTRILMIFAGPAMGYAIDQKGLGFAFYLAAGFYGVVFVFVLIPLLALRKDYDPIPGKA
ncbi:MAG: MFS transporter [Bdellovibrionales bacterium]|nr:MFS transporter [Bdellovibrionales bacterium]